MQWLRRGPVPELACGHPPGADCRRLGGRRSIVPAEAPQVRRIICVQTIRGVGRLSNPRLSSACNSRLVINRHSTVWMLEFCLCSYAYTQIAKHGPRPVFRGGARSGEVGSRMTAFSAIIDELET